MSRRLTSEDGSHIKANASKHKSVRDDRAGEFEARLDAGIEDLQRQPGKLIGRARRTEIASPVKWHGGKSGERRCGRPNRGLRSEAGIPPKRIIADARDASSDASSDALKSSVEPCGPSDRHS